MENPLQPWNHPPHNATVSSSKQRKLKHLSLSSSLKHPIIAGVYFGKKAFHCLTWWIKYIIIFKCYRLFEEDQQYAVETARSKSSDDIVRQTTIPNIITGPRRVLNAIFVPFLSFYSLFTNAHPKRKRTIKPKNQSVLPRRTAHCYV